VDRFCRCGQAEQAPAARSVRVESRGSVVLSRKLRRVPLFRLSALARPGWLFRRAARPFRGRAESAAFLSVRTYPRHHQIGGSGTGRGGPCGLSVGLETAAGQRPFSRAYTRQPGDVPDGLGAEFAEWRTAFVMMWGWTHVRRKLRGPLRRTQASFNESREYQGLTSLRETPSPLSSGGIVADSDRTSPSAVRRGPRRAKRGRGSAHPEALRPVR